MIWMMFFSAIAINKQSSYYDSLGTCLYWINKFVGLDINHSISFLRLLMISIWPKLIRQYSKFDKKTIPRTLGITTVRNPLGISLLQRNRFENSVVQVEESCFKVGVNLMDLKPMFWFHEYKIAPIWWSIKAGSKL